MRHHVLDIYKTFADAVVDGDKNFEVRKNRRGYNVGDTIEYQVIAKTGDGEIEVIESHPIHGKTYEITYVLSSWGLEPGYVAFGIEEKA